VNIAVVSRPTHTPIGSWVRTITGLAAVTGASAVFLVYLPWDFDLAWALEMAIFGLAAGVVLGVAFGLLVGIGAWMHQRVALSSDVASHVTFVRAWAIFVLGAAVGGLQLFGGGRFNFGDELGEIAGTVAAAIVVFTAVAWAYRRTPLVTHRYLTGDPVRSTQSPPVPVG
jgi:hypothetical protein